MNSGFWAPFFSIEIKGPSILIPTSSAPSFPSYSLAVSKICPSFSSEKVIDAGQIVVMPFFNSYSAIFEIASFVPSQKSYPTHAWKWISVRPGITYKPVASIISPSPVLDIFSSSTYTSFSSNLPSALNTNPFFIIIFNTF